MTSSICAQCAEVSMSLTACSVCGADPRLDGEYTLLEVVGHGAFGTTYRARDRTGEVVAIKELLVRKLESIKALELFEREANVLQQLNHRGVPRYIDQRHVDGGRSVSLYLVQEFIHGQTLEEEFQTRRATVPEVFLLAAELLDTLAYLHELRPSVIHRDIKPGNVMRSIDGRLVLIDFGAVRDVVDSKLGGSTVAGTFGYMAPEQFVGRALPATDIYGVGATIVALLSRSDPQQLMHDGRTLDWEDALRLPAGYAMLLRSMLQPDANHRASDAAELARRIRAHVTTSGAAEPTTPELTEAREQLLRVMNARAMVALRARARPHSPARRPSTSSNAVSTTFSPQQLTHRPLPAGFAKRFAAGENYNQQLGCGSLLFGLMIAIPGIFAFAAFLDGVTALLFVLFSVISLSIGSGIVWSARRRLAAREHAYRLGEPTNAVIVNVTTSSYSSNNRRANVYEFQYVVDGKVYKGSHDSWEPLMLTVGDEVTVFVAPDRPAVAILDDPDAYGTETYLIAKHRREVSLASLVQHTSEVELVAEEVEVAAPQPSTVSDDGW